MDNFKRPGRRGIAIPIKPAPVYKIPANAAITGSGLWFSIHIMSIHASTAEKYQSVVWFINLLSLTHPCLECRNHMTNYLTTHPLSQVGLKDLFRYTVEFHNAVNKRLNKPLISLEDATNLYSSIANIPCNSGCSNSPVRNDEKLEDSDDDGSYLGDNLY